MTVVEGAKPTGLVVRATNILIRPGAEWDVIATETATVPGLLLGYAAILALIPLIGTLISRVFMGLLFHSFFGLHGGFGGGFGASMSLVGGTVVSVVGYALTLALVFISALIINALAPSFDAKSDMVQALKVSVYANTAVWVAGFISWIPVIGWFLGGLVGFLALGYGCYLLYLGVAKVMKPPAEKAVGYTLVVIAIEVVLSLVVWGIVGMVAAMAMFGAAASGAAVIANAANHGDNLSRIEAASRQIEAAANAAEGGEANGKPIAAIDPQTLKAFLPDTIAGLPRTEIEATSAGTAGLGASDAEATYTAGDKRITLKVVDLAAAGGFAAMASAVHAESDKETATGYDKEGTVNGRWTTERYDTQSKDGEYSILVGNRFEVDAEGSGIAMDDLKSAVGAVGPDRLEALAHG